MRHLVYNKSYEFHEDAIIRISEADAIAKQRASCVRTRGADLYESDEEALLDFIAVNWAWYEDIINGTP